MTRRPLLPSLVLVLLLAAGLSCGLPGRRSPDGVGVDFSTATPGGSISISLLTPTAPGDFQTSSDQTTPIGPIATATAVANAANAATATAQALESRTFNPPATCPEQGNPAQPDRPATFDDYPEAIAEYLSLGVPPTVLEATLRSWYETDLRGQSIPGRDFAAAGGLVRSDRDFNADGVPDVLLVLPDPGSLRTPSTGDVFLFACQDATYRQLFRADTPPDHSVPAIISADDMLDIGYNQLIFVTESCETGVCIRDISVRGWGLTLGTFVDLAARPISLPGRISDGLGATAVDTSDDGVSEIIVNRGSDLSVEAGPPRPITEVWAWNGEVYDLLNSITSQAEYRIHVIHDGDTALERGEFDKAVDHYTQALADEELQSWTLPDEAQYLSAYALYRLMLVNGVRYDQPQAGNYFDELLAQYPPGNIPFDEGDEDEGDDERPIVPGGPGSVYSELAIAFWDSYLLQNDHGLACQSAVAFAQSRPDVLAHLNSFGYANRQYTFGDLCPFISQ